MSYVGVYIRATSLGCLSEGDSRTTHGYERNNGTVINEIAKYYDVAIEIYIGILGSHRKKDTVSEYLYTRSGTTTLRMTLDLSSTIHHFYRD
jgi:hypothetical protein